LGPGDLREHHVRALHRSRRASSETCVRVSNDRRGERHVRAGRHLANTASYVELGHCLLECRLVRRMDEVAPPTGAVASERTDQFVDRGIDASATETGRAEEAQVAVLR